MLDLDALGADLENEEPVKRERPAEVAGRVVHVDGDMIAYSCAGNDDTAPSEARQRALQKIELFRVMSGATSAVVHVTSPGCSKGERYLIATLQPYQGKRSTGRRPKNHQYLMDWLLAFKNGPDKPFRVKVWSSREADDGMAACAYAARPDQPVVIASKDKDMRMYPALHINWDSLEIVHVKPGDFEVVSPTTGKIFGSKWFWLQMLQGDSADHIPGLPHWWTTNAKGDPVAKLMGEKTAEKLLASCKNNAQAFAEVYGLYQDYYMQGCGYSAEEADDRFCEQAALLWMRAGREALVDDFATYRGPGEIGVHFHKELNQAVERLVQRVKDARAETEKLRSQAHEG